MSGRLHQRVYRGLLRLFPRTFRRERGEALEGVFLDMWRDRRRGVRAGLYFWARLVWDTAVHAAGERLSAVGAWGGARGETRGEGRGSMGDVWREARYAVRSLSRQPGYALLIALMMVLGIAGNAAVFRVFNGLFLRPLPFESPERLVDLDETAPRWNLEYVGIAYPDFAEWRGSRAFESMGAYAVRGANLADAAEAQRVEVVVATYDLAEVLRLGPVLGRSFTASEDVEGGPRVALLTQSFWRAHYGADPSVVGRRIVLNGEGWEVIGVLPAEAAFVAEADVWVPLREGRSSTTGWYLSGIGRLGEGVTAEQARADLLGLHRGLAEERTVNAMTAPVVSSLRDRYLGDYRLGSVVLLGAVAIVLLIACANIAGLMLVRSLGRTREVGVRLAMGAPRHRIVGQFLTESLLLAALGAGAGVALGSWGSSWLVRGLSDEFPSWVTFDLDVRFVLFTTVVTVGAAVLFGLAPAIQAAGVDAARVLGASATRSSATVRRRRGMRLLVGAEVALALSLLIVAGLSVRDFRQLRAVDPGFATENILTYRLSLPSTRYERPEDRERFYHEHVERVGALPGVTAAAAASTLPLSGHWGWFYEAEGAPERGPDESNPVVLTRAVTPAYFEAMGVGIVAGRVFNETDGADEASRAVIVNETFVREFLGHVDDDPVGTRIRTGEESPWMTVVGVSRDVKHYGLDEAVRPGVYQPFRQLPTLDAHIAARTGVDPISLLGPVRRSARELDPQLALFDIATMSERLDESLWARRAMSGLIAVFSIVALALAVAGLYGVISYSVTQRVHEIGIRMALGARREQVLGQVVRQGMGIVLLGVAAGVAMALAGARAVSGILVGISPTDPVVYLSVTALVLVIAALANLIPARRAARLEPMGVLRGE